MGLGHVRPLNAIQAHRSTRSAARKTYHSPADGDNALSSAVSRADGQLVVQARY